MFPAGVGVERCVKQCSEARGLIGWKEDMQRHWLIKRLRLVLRVQPQHGGDTQFLYRPLWRPGVSPTTEREAGTTTVMFTFHLKKATFRGFPDC